MGIKVERTAWDSIYALPTVIADEFLKEADSSALKVILHVTRHHGETPSLSDIVTGTGLTVEEVSRSLSFWRDKGLIKEDEKLKGTVKVKPAVKRTAKKNLDGSLPEIPEVLPNQTQILRRMEEDPSLCCLFQEVEMAFGKSIGNDTKSKILMMIDSYGLPPEVILTIINYATENNKKSMAYICKMAKSWAEQGVNTLEKTEKQIQKLENNRRLWNEFADGFTVNRPEYTESRMKLLEKWRIQYQQTNELIRYGYEEMIKYINGINFNYLDKILESWHKEGLKTMVEVCTFKNEKNKQFKNNGGQSGNNENVSFDIDEYKTRAVQPPTYRREER